MKFLCYIFLAILITPMAGMFIGVLANNFILENYPKSLFTIITFISAILIYSLYLHRNSYKYLNDSILTFFTGLIAITYLIYGKKIGEIIPSYETMKSHSYYYYFTITKLVIVANCLLAKLFINLDEFISNRIKENEEGLTISIYESVRKKFNFIKIKESSPNKEKSDRKK